MKNEETYLYFCPCCGFQDFSNAPYALLPKTKYTNIDFLSLTPPYCDSLGETSYEICPYCHFAFGTDDDAYFDGEAKPNSFERFLVLNHLIVRDYHYSATGIFKNDEQLKKQLKNAGLKYPRLEPYMEEIMYDHFLKISGELVY